ncbi:MAG: hypothetical protein PVI97_05735 [Candidatus Thiodiazotropha sp.]
MCHSLLNGLADGQPIRTISSEADLLRHHHAISTRDDDGGAGNGDEVLVWVYILGGVRKRA